MKNNNIENILMTDYIYIPYNEDMLLCIKEKDYIYKNELILKNETKNIYSTVSGNLLGLTNIDNKRYLVIENDYKEKTEKRIVSRKNINNYKKEELNDLINKYNVLDNFNIDSKVLIINGIDEFNTELTNKIVLKENIIKILDTIDALIEIMNIKKCFLAVSNDDNECVSSLLNNLGTYPKIDLKLFKNDNIIGKKEILIDKLTRYKNKKYTIQYLNIIDVLNIYNVLRKHIPRTSTYITITGDLCNINEVKKVNIGTNLADIINEYGIKKTNNIIINGLLNGIHIKNLNYIIDKNTRSIYINRNIKYSEAECINCGYCYKICPIKINPKYMYFNKDKKSKEYKSKCINCGMCSYVCPSKIDLNKGCAKND